MRLFGIGMVRDILGKVIVKASKHRYACAFVHFRIIGVEWDNGSKINCNHTLFETSVV